MQKDGYTFYLSVNGVWLTKEVPVPMTWTPLQDVIDAMPTFEISS